MGGELDARSRGAGLLWSVALILGLTLFPFDFAGVVVRPFVWDVTVERDWYEILLNVVLFVPFGFALGRRAARLPAVACVGVALLAGSALSAGVEGCQMFLYRHPSAADVVTNGLGALLGAVAAVIAGSRIAAALRRLLAWSSAHAAILVSLWGVVVVACVFRWFRPVTLAGWDLDYPMTIADEFGGGRPFAGTVHEARFVAGGLVADRAADQERLRAALRSAQSDNAFELRVVFTSANATQVGPARLLTISPGVHRRDVMAGQRGKDLVVRVRNEVSGDNGIMPAFVVPEVVRPGNRQLLAVTWRRGRLRVRVDSGRERRFDLTRWSGLCQGMGSVEAAELLGRGQLFYLLALFPFGLLLGLRLRPASIVLALLLPAAVAQLVALVGTHALEVLPVGTGLAAFLGGAAMHRRPSAPE